MANSEVAGGQSILAAKINEITVGTTAPASPVTGNAWMDTSSTPALVKTWNGAAWVLAAVNASVVTATGDLIYATGSAAPARLAIGSAAQILRVNAGIPNWYTPIGAATPVADSAAGSAGVSTVFSRDDHSHPANVLAGSGTSAGFNITLASIPGFVSVARMFISLTNPGGSDITFRLNSVATATYTNNLVKETGNTVTGRGVASETAGMIAHAGAANRAGIDLSLFDDGTQVNVSGVFTTIQGVWMFSTVCGSPATTLNILWTGSTNWSYRARAD